MPLVKKPAFRVVAVFLLALLLPVQGWAAACAQICARVNQAHQAAMMSDVAEHHVHHDVATPDEGFAGHEHCGDSEIGAGKCCQSHTFVVTISIELVVASIPSFERHFFVARWTSFIPEEPSPPPIAASVLA